MGATHLSGPLFVDGGIASGQGPLIAGKTFFVNPAAGGTDDVDSPFPEVDEALCFSTLQGAIDACVADRGDWIWVKRGSESISTMLDINKRGITIAAANFGMPMGMAAEAFTCYSASTLTSGPVATITDPCRIIGIGFAGRDTTTESLLIDCEESGGYSGGFTELIGVRISCWYGAMTYGIKQIGGAGNHFVNCYFDGLFGGFGTAAIGFFNDTGGQAPAHTLVEDCFFESVATYAIAHAVGSLPVNFVYRKNHLIAGWAAQGKFLNNNSVTAYGQLEENYLAPLANASAAYTNLDATHTGLANNHYQEA